MKLYVKILCVLVKFGDHWRKLEYFEIKRRQNVIAHQATIIMSIHPVVR